MHESQLKESSLQKDLRNAVKQSYFTGGQIENFFFFRHMLIDILVGRNVSCLGQDLRVRRKKASVFESAASANIRNSGLCSCEKSEINSAQDKVKTNVAFLIPLF